MAAHRWKKAISELRAKAKPSDYPDPEDGDVVELGLSHRAPPAATAGRKRRMTTSVSPSSRIDSSSATSGMPTENSSCLPASGTWTRGPSW